jgi:hypothetical protein
VFLGDRLALVLVLSSSLLLGICILACVLLFLLSASIFYKIVVICFFSCLNLSMKTFMVCYFLRGKIFLNDCFFNSHRTLGLPLFLINFVNCSFLEMYSFNPSF